MASKKLGVKPIQITSARPIQTLYYRDKVLVKVNSSLYANSAVIRCVDHMQLNDYGATIAEVFDGKSGVLHAVVTHSVIGKISIVYQREVKRGM